MARPLVVVLGENVEETAALVRAWSAEIPGLEIVALNDGRSMLRAIEARSTAALVVRADALASSTSALSDVARRFPTTAVLVLGGEVPKSGASRPAVMVSLRSEDHSAVLSFLREDVLKAARGSLSGVALASVLQVLHFEGRTCALRVRSQRRNGVLIIRNGALVHAEYRELAPQHAALELLGWSNADVVFEPAPPQSSPSITASLDFLLLEAARLQDERSVSGARNESMFPSMAALSTSDWRLPALLRGDAGPMLDEVMKIPGALSVELVDVENRLLLGRRVIEGESVVAPERLAAIARSVFDMVIDQDMSDWMEEIVLNFSTRFKIIRPLRVAPNLVLCAAFAHKGITLGLAKTMVAHAIDKATAGSESPGG